MSRINNKYKSEPSPIQGANGAPMKPRILNKTVNGHNIEEAHYYCPVSGQFVRKIILGTTEIKSK